MFCGSTVICALQRAEHGCDRFWFKTPPSLAWSMVCLLLLAMLKLSVDNGKLTVETFAHLSFAVLQHIITFANDPFRIMVS